MDGLIHERNRNRKIINEIFPMVQILKGGFQRGYRRLPVLLTLTANRQSECPPSNSGFSSSSSSAPPGPTGKKSESVSLTKSVSARSTNFGAAKSP